MNVRTFLGGTVAIAVLLLYAGSVVWAIHIASIASATAQSNDMVFTTMSTTGGLVSALIAAVLAYTPPGASPAAPLYKRFFKIDVPQAPNVAANSITILYIVIWTLAGIAAVLASFSGAGELKELTVHGKEWLGSAVAAGYAYFRLDPTK